MAIAGKIFVLPRPATRSWDVVVHNKGDRPVGVTSVLLDDETDRVNYIGDDFDNHGHGLLCNPGKVSSQTFFEGETYGHWKAGSSVEIGEHCDIRLGIRGAAETTVKLPPLEGDPVVLDLAEDLHYYDGTPLTAKPITTGTEELADTPMDALEVGEMRSNIEDSRALLAELATLLRKQGIRCEGSCAIVPVMKGQRIIGWDVEFKNRGERPWIGTVVFQNAAKNAGAGLESMPCPGRKTAAVQRIDAAESYGTKPVAGSPVRVGVRGLGYANAALPEAGAKVHLPLSRFHRDSSTVSEEFFDLDAVRAKRNEKVRKVQFFENGRRINDELEPIVHSGAEALARSTFDPPKVQLTRVEGGWELEVRSTLPQADELGPLCFLAAPSLVAEGKELPLQGQLLSRAGEVARWQLSDSDVPPGSRLKFEARGTGWYADLELPHASKPLNTTRRSKVWRLREDLYERSQLDPARARRRSPVG